jgi:ABC-type branched-subunit amino acid transport system ATPase component
MSDPLLDIGGLYAAYVSGVDILQGLSLAVERGSVTLIIGPNGAGKSTLLRTIFGLIKPHRGYIRLAGAPINGREPAAIKALGIGYVPQEINVFPLLTIEENLRMGGWIFRRDRARLTSALDRVFATFPVLADRRSAAAGTLSGGQGRMLSVAREMMTTPDLMLVDNRRQDSRPHSFPKCTSYCMPRAVRAAPFCWSIRTSRTRYVRPITSISSISDVSVRMAQRASFR